MQMDSKQAANHERWITNKPSKPGIRLLVCCPRHTQEKKSRKNRVRIVLACVTGLSAPLGTAMSPETVAMSQVMVKYPPPDHCNMPIGIHAYMCHRCHGCASSSACAWGLLCLGLL